MGSDDGENSGGMVVEQQQAAREEDHLPMPMQTGDDAAAPADGTTDAGSPTNTNIGGGDGMEVDEEVAQAEEAQKVEYEPPQVKTKEKGQHKRRVKGKESF